MIPNMAERERTRPNGERRARTPQSNARAASERACSRSRRPPLEHGIGPIGACERDRTMWENEWTTDTVIRLMQEYKQRPELWDTNHPLYRVHTAKYDAWSELAHAFDCDIADLRKKLNSIFASHRREKAKVRSGGRSSWFLYRYMKFLPNHIDNNSESIHMNTKNEYETQNQDTEHTCSEDEENDQEEVIVKQEPTNQVTTRLKKRYVAATSQKKKHIKRPITSGDHSTRQLESKLIEALKLLKRSDISRRKDECDTFGEYIATSLRKHDERTQSMIKQAINNILFEQEMKKYSSGQYTVVLTSMDENPLVLGDQETDK